MCFGYCSIEHATGLHSMMMFTTKHLVVVQDDHMFQFGFQLCICPSEIWCLLNLIGVDVLIGFLHWNMTTEDQLTHHDYIHSRIPQTW